MKFLVTGCYGFIGKKTTEKLLSLGHEVIGMDVFFSDSINHKNFNFVPFDFPTCLNSFDGIDVSVIYHFAWCGVSTTDKNDIDKQIQNIEITLNVLKLAKSISAKRIIIPGSISEFSRCKKAVTGNEKATPSDLYAATKIAVRIIATKFCNNNNIGLNWVLITSVYGGERKDNNLLTYTICNLLKDKIVETTKLEQKWDYIYIDDLIDALILVGTKGKKNTIYPIGSGRSENLSYYVNCIAKIIGKDYLLKVGVKEYKNAYIDNSIVDISKLKKLGFSCQKTFEDNITNIIDFYKKGI